MSETGTRYEKIFNQNNPFNVFHKVNYDQFFVKTKFKASTTIK